MYPVTPEFAAAVIGSHTAVTYCDVILGADVLGELTIEGGAVTVDCRRDGPLRTLDLLISPTDDAWTWLTSYGAEVRAYRGVRLESGDELVPLGVFVVDQDVTRDDKGSISLSASDRSQRISRARWIEPYTVAAGTDVGTAIGAILADRWADVELGFTTVGLTTGAQVVFENGADSDPWKDARSLAESVSLDLYFDGSGVAQLRAVPDPTTATPDVNYPDGSVVLTQTQKAVLSVSYNGVIATGEGSGIDVPLRGEAWDDDTESPTYRFGPFGQVPYFYSSPLLTTQAQVDSAAAAILSRVRGRAEQMEWSLIVNPALEAFDVVDVDVDGTTRRFILDSVTIPLAPSGAMQAIARETRF